MAAEREAAEQLACPWLWGKIWHLTGELASADEKTEETGEAVATLHCGGNTPFNEGSSEVMFSGGRMQKEVCSLPAANRTCRAPEGVSLSALGPAANLTKCFLVFANRETQSAAAAAGAGCQVPRGNPDVCQVISSAWEKWPPSQCMWPEAWSGAVSPTLGG